MLRARTADPGSPSSAPRRRALPTVALSATAALALVAGLVACQPATPPTTTTTTTTVPGPTSGPGDGTTIDRAGASCWGIKQQYPRSGSGVYWLYTPTMDRPAQFYCDMVSDGGGWVLIGRGRDGWTFQPTGQGSASQVRSTVSGPGAFAPAALDSETITGLIDGAAVHNLSQGVRVERMTNAAGTTHQEVVLHLTQDHWNWTFHAGQLLSKIVIDGTTYQGSNTYDTSASVAGQSTNGLAGAQGTRRLFTWAWADNGNRQGFSFGRGGPAGSTSSTSNLYQYSASGYTLPFTRVWLRPKFANSRAFAPIPTGGYAPAPRPAQLSDRSELAPWGVVGLDHTGEANVEPYNTPVLTLQATTDRVFVGGRFTGVQHGPSGTPVAQASLAAFDLDGNWISSFRPTIAGRVWDLALTGDGKLIVAGDFTSVDGVPGTAGLAALDPSTGAVVPGWKADVARVGGSEWRVRTLDVRGSWIYAAGLFDRVTGGTASSPTTVANAVSLSTATGALGPWRPTPNGSVIDLAVTGDGTRVLLAGAFGSVGGSTTHGHFAVTDLATGTPTAGTGAWQPSNGSASDLRYQQAVADLGDRLLVGGSQHDTQVWNRSRTTLLDASIAKPGGDTQVIEVVGTKAYVGCHCGGWTYLGTNDWLHPSGFRAIEPINLVAAFDTATWTYDTSWYPGSLKGAAGEGVWAVDADARGCLWVGGDLDRGAYTGEAATDWLGGFARFCPLDTTVPTTPGGVTVTGSGTTRTVSWSAATDPDGTAPTYQVIRDGKVVAVVNAATRSWTDTAFPAGARYTVRASDARGNRSGSAPPVAG